MEYWLKAWALGTEGLRLYCGASINWLIFNKSLKIIASQFLYL